MVRNAHSSDTEKDEFEISNKEVVEIIRLQVFDSLAGKVKKPLKEKCNLSCRIRETWLGKEFYIDKALNLAKHMLASKWLKSCNGTVPEIGLLR
jgi:hypothetical protein